MIHPKRPLEKNHSTDSIYFYGQVANNATFIGGQDSFRAYLGSRDKVGEYPELVVFWIVENDIRLWIFSLYFYPKIYLVILM